MQKLINQIAKSVKDLDPAGLELGRVHILKFGCLLFTHKSDEIDEKAPPEPTREMHNYYRVYSSINKALQRHANVFDLKIPDIDHVVHSVPVLGGTIVTCPTFTLRVSMPYAHQKYVDHWGTPIETFHVNSSGSLFCAYAEVHEFPVATWIAQEYQEMFRTQMQKETEYRCPVLGPTPIHPDFYVVELIGEDMPLQKVLPVLDYDILLLFAQGIEIHEVIESVFNEVRQTLSSFYTAMKTTKRLITARGDILSQYSNIGSGVSHFVSLPWWHFFSRARSASGAEHDITDMYASLAEEHLESAMLETHLSNLRDDVEKSDIMRPISKYLIANPAPEFTLPMSLLPGLEHFTQAVRGFVTARVALIASVLGAVVGAVLVNLLSSGG